MLSGVVVPVLDVALLAEGVDRNQSGTEHSSIPDVALLAEGVDRNKQALYNNYNNERRPPRGGRG